MTPQITRRKMFNIVIYIPSNAVHFTSIYKGWFLFLHKFLSKAKSSNCLESEGKKIHDSLLLTLVIVLCERVNWLQLDENDATRNNRLSNCIIAVALTSLLAIKIFSECLIAMRKLRHFPNQSEVKTKSNRDLVAHVFPRLALVAGCSICFEFWLVRCVFAVNV